MKELHSKLDTLLAMILSGAGGGGNLSLEVLDKDLTADIGVLPTGSSIDLEVDFADVAVLQTVNIKTIEDDVEKPFSVTIKNAPDGVLEYTARGNLEYCYDVVDILYIDSLENKKLYLNISNDSDSSIEFDYAIIRGIEIN